MIKRLLTVFTLVIAAAALCVTDADARRMGGGRSFGAQRSIAPQPAKPAPSQAPANAATPAQPAPTGNAAAAPRQPTPQAAPAPSGASRWLGPLAGIAAGIGLAALLSHFGVSGDFAGVLLALLAVVAAVFLLRRVFARRPVSEAKPLAYAGNATPSERIEPVLPAYQGQAVSTIEPAAIPAEFDAPRFLKQARMSFNRLQAAYDSDDRATLADMMTPEMYAEIIRDIETRGHHQATEIVQLDSEVVDVKTEDKQHWASVRFTGLLREDGSALPQAFDEVWNLTKPVDGSHGWLLAGIQQLPETIH